MKHLHRRQFIQYLGLAAGSALVTVGCNQEVLNQAKNSDNSAANNTETAAGTQANTAPTISGNKIRVGFQTGDINNVTMVAYHENHFKNAGLDVELVPFTSGADMISALGGNSVDVTWFFPFPALSAFARGIPIEVFLLDHAPQTGERLLAKGLDDTKSLKGKKIGVTFGSTGHYFTLQALQKANLTSRDVTLVNLKPAGMAPAYAANQIDAAWTWEPAAGKLNELGATTLETVKSVGGYAAALWAVRKAYAEKSPEAISAFIKAWDAAQQAYLKDPEAGQKWEAKRLNLSDAEFAAMVERQGTRVIPVKEQPSADWLGTPGQAKGTKIYQAFEKYGKFLEELGRIKQAPTDYSSLINSSYIQKYLISTAQKS